MAVKQEEDPQHISSLIIVFQLSPVLSFIINFGHPDLLFQNNMQSVITNKVHIIRNKWVGGRLLLPNLSTANVTSSSWVRYRMCYFLEVVFVE